MAGNTTRTGRVQLLRTCHGGKNKVAIYGQYIEEFGYYAISSIIW